MSGYDIKKRVNSALGAATNASYGTLYPTLHKLLDEGSVEVEEVLQRGRPSKKIYCITPQGENELREWLKQPAAADQIRREFLLKLYLANRLPPQEMLSLVTTRREETETLLKTLQGEMNNHNNPQQAWIVDYALALCQAEVEWLKRVEGQIGVAPIGVIEL